MIAKIDAPQQMPSQNCALVLTVHLAMLASAGNNTYASVGFTAGVITRALRTLFRIDKILILTTLTQSALFVLLLRRTIPTVDLC
jgi:hypothetical protein